MGLESSLTGALCRRKKGSWLTRAAAGPTALPTGEPRTMGRGDHPLPSHQAERSHHTTQAGLTGSHDGGEGRQPPLPVPTSKALQQSLQGRTEWPGAKSHDEGCHRPEDRTHRAGKVVSTTRPPGGLMDVQWIKVHSKMTRKTRAATPVNRSRSLVQVQLPSHSQIWNRGTGMGGRTLQQHRKQTRE